MEDRDRQALRSNRMLLVTSLQMGDIWDPLVKRGVFTNDMIEEIQRAGTRRDQARQLLVELETRGSQAFPLFLLCLQETGQHSLADALMEGGGDRVIKPAAVSPAPLPPIYAGRRETSYNPVRKPKHLDIEADYPMNFDPCGYCLIINNVEFAEFTNLSYRGGSDIDREKMEMRMKSYHFDVSVKNNLKGAVTLLAVFQDYPMNFDPCGYCLIINNVEFAEFTNLSYRGGSDIDREKMEMRMKSYHFDVSVKNNLKGAEIYEELQLLASKDHSKKDCCLIIILSHGCETRHTRFPGGVYGTDGVKISVERIVNFFNGHNCPSLGGKPKLFFIQACGGDQKDRGVTVESADLPEEIDSCSLQSDAIAVRPSEEDGDETDAVASLPTSSDILVSYSTFPGYVSWRDKKSGSWYVETLDEVLESYATTLDLQALLVMVANIVSSKGTYKQIPGYFNFLRKKFFFKTD
ncbi:PREDICTED: caspase-9 [Nanorana parkeri]|uniref:caspase-9 n=1 Tax=Nanorana parkeri TaxID=125878 RepID=UPI000853FE8E|nr:PREDICTED: caspase-9 [Nanorana parkeri]